MKALALMTMVATALLVAHAESVLSNEVETATAIRIKHGDRTRFAGLVPVGNDRKMYLECVGTGSPTVVLISGFRGARDDWTYVIDPANPAGDPVSARSAVFPKVGKFIRVCAYDRPGTIDFGGRPTDSTPVLQPTTAWDGAVDLHVLLTAAGEPGPFVVVAHSWGGLIARLFASRHPNAVVGLVLLDPGSEFLEAHLTPSQWTSFVLAAKALGAPPELEAADYEPSVAALRAASPVRAIPAVVLSSDKPFDFGAGGAETWPAWGAAQHDVASVLDARHVTRTDSGHFIQGAQPQLVVKAIRKVVEAVCKKMRCNSVRGP
jgi:pimeloyl-ACP methyl ester carboxylesterase